MSNNYHAHVYTTTEFSDRTNYSWNFIKYGGRIYKPGSVAAEPAPTDAASNAVLRTVRSLTGSTDLTVCTALPVTTQHMLTGRPIILQLVI